MIETISGIITRSRILVAPDRVEIFIAGEHDEFSWGALAKPRPGMWRGIHIAILTPHALANLEEEHEGFTKRGYLHTSRWRTDDTKALDFLDHASKTERVRVRASISADGRAEQVEIIRPIRRNR
jgi:hypothetical protein